jgi:hypothetical protein
MTDQEREALEFYANSYNYVPGNGGRPSSVDADGGRRAKAVLARAALAAREEPQAEEMLRLPGTPSKSWRGGGTMGRRRSRMSEPTTALGDQGDGEPSETRQALIRRAAQAMWEAGPTTHRGGWEDLTERQQEFACHEARAAVDVALAAREEPTGSDALCECGHIAHWHAAVTYERKTGRGARKVSQGRGVCEFDDDCNCEEFRVGLFSDTVICCDHGKIATAHCEMSGDGIVTLGELIESYSNPPPLTAREDTERPEDDSDE